MSLTCHSVTRGRTSAAAAAAGVALRSAASPPSAGKKHKDAQKWKRALIPSENSSVSPGESLIFLLSLSLSLSGLRFARVGDVTGHAHSVTHRGAGTQTCFTVNTKQQRKKMQRVHFF